MALNVEEAKQILELLAKCSRAQLKDLYKQIGERIGIFENKRRSDRK